MGVAQLAFGDPPQRVAGLHRAGLVRKARVVLMRRATDPWESHLSGMINTLVPETAVLSEVGTGSSPSKLNPARRK